MKGRMGEKQFRIIDHNRKHGKLIVITKSTKTKCSFLLICPEKYLFLTISSCKFELRVNRLQTNQQKLLKPFSS